MKKENKAGHTPGPWVISQNKILTGGYCDPDRVIATASYRQSGYVQSNIKLIAAAPELLEAAERGLNCALSLDDEESQLDSEFIRSAIAKARGR